jgi:hypothetical protein
MNLNETALLSPHSPGEPASTKPAGIAMNEPPEKLAELQALFRDPVEEPVILLLRTTTDARIPCPTWRPQTDEL